ncbi:flagellar basal body rod protein FlgC [Sinimarinibacterium sp. CAU 1509]|uniref:flagellar basal body rod protein FlgC n=1 Tax=Sinimarinibacterium sp. CAU 1509 TaxID=2562283 RepID=UPI0010AD4653|nr:flagellar basal body rod protein FlgC [Sinimarinibacterium sp. CAU 1509]TJY62877.1 flagellar basal body rod protein FlgC [Sinimarinibacterium sp. CAU 1509]
MSRIFDIAGSALAAQSVRLNTVASNLANADAVGSDPDAVYKARMPVFRTINDPGSKDSAGVQVMGVVESQAAPEKRYEPGHPMADAEGYVYAPNVNVVEEMVNMISASRSYQSSIEVMNTAKDLALRTLTLGK